MRIEEIVHRIFRQVIWGSGIVYTRDVLLRMIGELLWAVSLSLAKDGVRIAVCKREWRSGGRVG